MRTKLKQIADGPLPRVILVHGPEIIYHDRIYAALKERSLEDGLGDWNWSVFHGNKEFELEPLLMELGMVAWGNSPKIVVLKEGDLISAASMEKLAHWLEQNPEANCLALFLDKVDNRLKYLKILRNFALEFNCEPIEGEELLRYVVDFCTEQGKAMKRATAVIFLERVGSNLLVVHNELEKLFAWTNGREEIMPADIGKISCLSPGQIANHTVFQMTDFIVQKRRQQALDVLELLISAGEPPFRILPLIERQLRLVLAAKTCTNNLDEAAKQMGETNSYALKKIQPYSKKFSLDEIFAGFTAILHADREMKLGMAGDQVLADLIVKLT